MMQRAVRIVGDRWSTTLRNVLGTRYIKPELSTRSASVAAMTSEKGMTVFIDMKGMERENVKVAVEGNFLVVDANKMEVVREAGGEAKKGRQVYRRYKILKNSDLQNIQATLSNDSLEVFIPLLKPQIKWTSKC